MNLKITETSPTGKVTRFRLTIKRSPQDQQWWVLRVSLEGELIDSKGPYETEVEAERAQLDFLKGAKLTPLTPSGADLVRKAQPQ